MGKGRLKQAMELAGSQHKFQTAIVILLSAAWILANFMFLSSTYIFMEPVFQCQKHPNLIVHQLEACQRLHQCQIIGNFTLTSQVKLYCQKQQARVTVQSIFPIGAFIGLIVMNLLSDTKGRKFAFLITLMISIVGILLILQGGNSNNIFLLTVSQFLLGFGSYPIVPIGYTLLSDFFSDKFRPIAVIIINAVGGFSAFALGIFYLNNVNWFNFLLIVILIPLIVLLAATVIFLEESPYILMNQNKQQQALQVLKRISIFNGRGQNFIQIRRIVQAQSTRDSDSQASLQNVYKKVKQWKYLKSIILVTFIYGIANLNYFGISYSFEEEGFGFGYNSMIAGFVQMGSFVFLNPFSDYTVRYVKRRPGIAIFYGFVMVIGLCFLIPSIKSNLMISTLLLAISRICSTNAYCLIACVQTQAFTVSIQSTAAGLIQALALYGALLAPIVVDISSNFNIDPIATVAFFVNFAIWPNYFLRQTFKKSNPQLQGPLFTHLKDYTQMSDLTSVTSQSSN